MPRHNQKGKLASEVNRDVICYKERFGWSKFRTDERIESRSHHVSLELGNELLVGGGQDSDYNKLNDFWYAHLGIYYHLRLIV